MTAAALEAARALLAGCDLAPGADGADPLTALLYDRWFHAMTGAVRNYPEAAAYAAIALAARPFEPDWIAEAPVEGVPGAIRARRGATLREAPPLFWVGAARDSLRPMHGEPLLLSPWRCAEQGGFWHLWSPVWPARPARRITRWYFRLAAEAEPGFVALLAAHAPLDRAFACKLLCGAHQDGRRDTAVLYAPVERAAWLATLFAALAPCLESGDGPPFTEVLAPGIASADDPGNTQSFGQHRCSLLASAARQRPEALSDAAAWRASVTARFEAEGLSLDQPWRRGGAR